MRTIELLGVEENGIRRSPRVPINVRAQLRWTLQSDVLIRLKALQPNGAPLVLTGCTVVIGARKAPGTSAVLFAATGVVTGRNEVVFVLYAGSQTSWQPGWYVWEVWCTNPGGERFQLVPASPLLLDPVVLPAGITGGGGVPAPVTPITITATAGQTFTAPRVPVYVADDGLLYVVGNDELSVSAMCGLLKTTGAVGDLVEVYLPNQRVSGFSGLTMGREMWAWNGQLTWYEMISTGDWGRPVGYPLALDALLFMLGTPVGKYSGPFGPVPEPDREGSGPVMAGVHLAFGNVVYLDPGSGSPTLRVFNGTEPHAAAIVGISDGPYAGPITAHYYVENACIIGLTFRGSPTPGDEMWAYYDPISSIGGISNWNDLVVGQWSKRLGICLTPDSMRVQFGGVQMRV